MGELAQEPHQEMKEEEAYMFISLRKNPTCEVMRSTGATRISHFSCPHAWQET